MVLFPFYIWVTVILFSFFPGYLFCFIEMSKLFEGGQKYDRHKIGRSNLKYSSPIEKKGREHLWNSRIRLLNSSNGNSSSSRFILFLNRFILSPQSCVIDIVILRDDTSSSLLHFFFFFSLSEIFILIFFL